MSVLQTLHRVLCCPDDGGTLHLDPDRMVCDACGRGFAAEENYVSLVASTPAILGSDTRYRRFYLAARGETEDGAAPIYGWQISPSAPKYFLERKRRQVIRVGSLLAEGCDTLDLVCDFSAGPGYYTFDYARTWRLVIHCDLCADSIREVRSRARRAGLGNILFVRMDYLKPPFRGTLPRILCMDSLVRGRDHERMLLRSITGALAADGAAVVDFHNWWHNPLRRLGLLRNNFGQNRSYARRELAAVLSDAGITRYECFPFHQEIDTDSPVAGIVTRVLPPTRWMYRYRHDAEPHSRPA